MTLSVSAWLNGKARPVMAAMGARAALHILNDLADFQNYLKLKVKNLKPKDSLPPVVADCLAACQAVSGGLTSLAAVAGAVAGQVAKQVVAQGADQVIVNNGGDIALRTAPGNTLRVGLRPQADDVGAKAELSGALKVRHGSGIGGVASSGWQGRSFSPGLADLVTVWASGAALADAAATWIAGRCSVGAPGIQQIPACELDPQSGLEDMPVTIEVPPLSDTQKQAALAPAIEEAQQLMARGVILGCRLELQGMSALMDASGACLDEPSNGKAILPGRAA
jgi:ApbE superfamily uncharacterized protein (UPF0280 family)